MGSVGDTLRLARTRLNLTQKQAGELLATSQANISAYERGRLMPGRIVRKRIEVFGLLQPESMYASYSASTMPSTAASIRADLTAGRSESAMLRVIIQASDDFAKLTEPADREFFLTEPSPTSSPAWDALLAGLAVHLCRQAHMERTPLWTSDPSRTIDGIWWFDSNASTTRALLLSTAIPNMRSRGVIFNRRNLESV